MTELLSDPRRQRSDLRTIHKNVVTRRIPVPDEAWGVLFPRLMEIAAKKTVCVAMKDGPVASEAKADEHALKAIAIIAAMVKINQDDEHHADRLKQKDEDDPDRTEFLAILAALGDRRGTRAIESTVEHDAREEHREILPAQTMAETTDLP